MPTSHHFAPSTDLQIRASLVCRVARCSLGFVWIYEGLIPKVLFRAAHPEQTDLILRSGLYWPTPESTIVALGLSQVVLGIILLSGWREKLAALAATVWMAILIVLVVRGMPNLLTDPFGAVAKDACLTACAFVVYYLHEEPSGVRRPGK